MFYRLETQLLKIEQKRKVTRRWAESSSLYKDWTRTAATRQRTMLIHEIRKHAVDRAFLLQAKSKEARKYTYVNTRFSWTSYNLLCSLKIGLLPQVDSHYQILGSYIKWIHFTKYFGVTAPFEF